MASKNSVLDEPTMSDKRLCGNCGDERVTGYCQKCKHICDSCKQFHSTMAVFKSHQLLSLNEAEHQPSILTPRRVIPHCPVHVEKKLKLYCETCQQHICTHCTYKLHKDHSYDTADSVLSKCKKELELSLKPVLEKLNRIEDDIEVFDTRVQEINSQKHALKEDIHKVIDQHKQLLDKREAELEEELETLTQRQIEMKKRQLENAKTKISNFVTEVRNANIDVLQRKTQEIPSLLTDSEIELHTPNTQIVIYPGDSELLQTALTSVQIIEGSQEEIMNITEQNEGTLPITLAAGKPRH